MRKLFAIAALWACATMVGCAGIDPPVAQAMGNDPATRQQRVASLLKLGQSAATPLEGAKAVDNYLNTLPDDERAELEGDTWQHLRRTGAIDRTAYIQNMLELNERFFPRDYITLDYWRYLRMIDAKVKNGLIPEEEYRYLADKKFDEAKADHERRARIEQVERARAAQSEAAAAGWALQSMGEALRQRYSAPQPSMGSSINCTSRTMFGTTYTDCR